MQTIFPITFYFFFEQKSRKHDEVKDNCHEQKNLLAEFLENIPVSMQYPSFLFKIELPALHDATSSSHKLR